MSEADLKTLRLAAPAITGEGLKRYLRYQRARLAQGESAPAAPGWEGRVALSHAEALRASGLDPAELSRIAPVCADFCARRWPARELAGRRAEAARRILEAQQNHTPPPAGEVEVLQAIDQERLRLEDLGPLERRYGADSIAQLRAVEEELLTLHRALAQAP